MEKKHISVGGMSCVSCTRNIKDYFEKEGYENIQINFMTGDINYELGQAKQSLQDLENAIRKLGYSVNQENENTHKQKGKWLDSYFSKFIFCLFFTLPLLSHMFIKIDVLDNPFVQLLLTLPVLILGSKVFGTSAIRSIINKKPNMDVLIFIGANSAFLYSFIGSIIFGQTHYLFFETTATIYTFVFLGNFLEKKSIDSTQKEIKKLLKKQEIEATMITFDNNQKEILMKVKSNTLKIGDLLLIQAGDIVPTDCKILSGNCKINESIITGESNLISKKQNDELIGGSLLEDGTIKVIVTTNQQNTILSKIITLVQQAQNDTPPVQKLADKISTIFIPTVLAIASITFLANYLFFDISFKHSLMRSIAVMVIACPCALGLATPAALSVGLGIGVRKGILFKNAKILNYFQHISICFFDKTGTLTHSEKKIVEFESVKGFSKDKLKNIVFTAEAQSNHPLAKTIVKEWDTAKVVGYKSINEVRGKGMILTDKDDNIWKIGSTRFNTENQQLPSNKSIYIFKNNTLVGWVDTDEAIKDNALAIIKFLKKQNITPILISGDTEEKCKRVAKLVEIEQIYFDQSPESKQKLISKYKQNHIVAMVGDGINDAPSLSNANVGISIQGANQLALKSSDLVIIRDDISYLASAFLLGKKTYNTIKGNLFWAFSYNIVAIPIASVGLLSPTFGALIMGFSDVVLLLNSLLLFTKKIKRE